MNRIALLSADSMPRPSRSNFTSPMEAQSSLSHCSTLRFCMRPHSTGHTSMIGLSQMTMPPEWMPRCRGMFSTSAAISSTRPGMSWSSFAAVTATVPHASTCLLQESCFFGEWPSARAMSRTAERDRYVMTFATCAAWWRPWRS